MITFSIEQNIESGKTPIYLGNVLLQIYFFLIIKVFTGLDFFFHDANPVTNHDNFIKKESICISLLERLGSLGPGKRLPPFHLLAMAVTLPVSLHLFSIEMSDSSTSEKLTESTSSVTAYMISNVSSKSMAPNPLSINVIQ